MKRLTTLPVVFFSIFCLFTISSAKTPFPDDSIVRQKCSACHKIDQKGSLEVIDETRKSPEEWKVVVDRMIRLNNAPLEEKYFKPVIQELSNYLCLSPHEMAQVAHINSDENSQYKELPKNEQEVRIYTACARCHTFAKITSHRNTEAQWSEVRNLHLGYYPTTIAQMREMDWAQESKDLIKPLAKMFPFDSPEWQNWMANRKEQNLEGRWQIAGYQPGIGYYEGSYSFKADPAMGPDNFLVEREVRFLNGTSLKMGGTATLYSQYHLELAFAPTPLTGRVKGVFDLDANAGTFSGKWWTVVQDSNAFGNEQFVRSDSSPKIIAAFPQALKKQAGKVQQLTLIGVNLPENLSPADIKFSSGSVKVDKLGQADANKIVCWVVVDPGVSANTLKFDVKNVTYVNPITVYDRLDGIKIFPELGRARVSSGAAYPPQGVQFVARGMNYGPDGKPGTEDDLILEPVNANWWLEEENTANPQLGRETDEDLKFLQAPITNGLYTPVTTYAPIAERPQNREGVGLIAVGAAYSEDGQEFKDRAKLAVTVPDFVTHLK